MSHNMHEIHPEHPLSEPQIPRSGKSAIRPSGGPLSERRLAYFLSGAPTSCPRPHPGARVAVSAYRRWWGQNVTGAPIAHSCISRRRIAWARVLARLLESRCEDLRARPPLEAPAYPTDHTSLRPSGPQTPTEKSENAGSLLLNGP